MSNPYQPTAETTRSNREIRIIRSVLETYKKYRDREMPLFDVIRLYMTSWLGRDIAHGRAQTRMWPIVRDVLHWQRIDIKLEELTQTDEGKENSNS